MRFILLIAAFAWSSNAAFADDNLELAARFLAQGPSCGVDRNTSEEMSSKILENEIAIRGKARVSVELWKLSQAIAKERQPTLEVCGRLLSLVLEETKRDLLGPEGLALLEADIAAEAEIAAKAIYVMRQCVGWRINSDVLASDSPARKKALEMVDADQIKNPPSAAESCAIAEREFGPNGTTKKAILIRGGN